MNQLELFPKSIYKRKEPETLQEAANNLNIALGDLGKELYLVSNNYYQKGRAFYKNIKNNVKTIKR